MSRGVHVNWLKSLKSEDEQVAFKQLLVSSPVTRRLKEIVKEKEDNNHRQETILEDYDTPSWAYRQADRNGYMRCLREFKELLNFIEE